MTSASPARLDRVVIVGASLAGLRAAETLRQNDFAGEVVVIGAEAHSPYDRPPLSKRFLSGEWDVERIVLRRADALAELGLTWRLGAAATRLDVAAREVALADGDSVPFDGLIVATGAQPRRLPGQPDWPGVHMLRGLGDALALRADLAHEPRRVVVIGAGFIGLEVAATARQMGHDVTVLEGAPAPLMRGLGAEMGTAVASVHGRNGVRLRCGVGVTGFLPGVDGRVGGVSVRDQEGEHEVPGDVVLVGVGVAPATSWLEGSGLELRDGVVCDATLCAGPVGVYAAGDVARWPHPLLDHEVRVEHWTNASEQGAAAAENMLAVAAGGTPTPYGTVPFFWSDQFDARIQYLGRAEEGDVAEVVAGHPDDGKFVALYRRGDRLVGVLGVSMPRVVMPLRAILAAGGPYSEALDRISAASS